MPATAHSFSAPCDPVAYSIGRWADYGGLVVHEEQAHKRGMLTSGMLSELLPVGVGVAEILGDDPLAVVLPAEAEALGGAGARRRDEFRLGRECARRALRSLGVGPVAVLRGPNREPRWPDGIVGSITHCQGYAAAAVAARDRFVTLGIDAELAGGLPADVARLVLTEAERSAAGQYPPGLPWQRLLFSAKESVFKACFPLSSRWLDFQDANVSFDLLERTFRARLRVNAPRLHGRTLDELPGRFAVENGYILTAIAVPAEP